MSTNAKYLRITIHDNDFTNSLEHIGCLLQQVFEFECEYPTEKDFPILKEMIKHLWYGTHHTMRCLRYNDYIETPIDYFNCELEFVNFLDIPDWDNFESIYIPMFYGEILIR